MEKKIYPVTWCQSMHAGNPVFFNNLHCSSALIKILLQMLSSIKSIFWWFRPCIVLFILPDSICNYASLTNSFHFDFSLKFKMMHFFSLNLFEIFFKDFSSIILNFTTFSPCCPILCLLSVVAFAFLFSIAYLKKNNKQKKRKNLNSSHFYGLILDPYM